MSYGTITPPSTIPQVDLSGAEYRVAGDASAAMYGVLSKLSDSDLVSDAVSGNGTFNSLMRGFSAFLKAEYQANRITGAEYTKAFIALTESAMASSVQYLLGKDQAFWQAQGAQITAINARVVLENTKYQLGNLMPAQLALLQEQLESQRAQTLDTRTDGTTAVSGTLGKQRELYDQQITSYLRSSELNAAKLFSDAWITRKTIDEGLSAPTGFENVSVDTVLAAIKANNNLG